MRVREMQLSQNATEKRGAPMVAFRGTPPVNKSKRHPSRITPGLTPRIATVVSSAFPFFRLLLGSIGLLIFGYL